MQGKSGASGALAHGRLSPEALLSLGSMEGVYEPIVAPVIPPFEADPDYCEDLTDDAFRSLDSMEGVMQPVVRRAAAAQQAARERAVYWPGFTLAAVIGAVAYLLHYAPVAPFTATATSGARHPISAALIAIVAGLLVRNTLAIPSSIKPGCKRIVRKLIPVAIVCMGAGLNLGNLASIGITALVITVLCIIIAVAGGYYIGRGLNLSPKTAILLGAGTGICGNSAIVAVAPLIDAEDDDVLLSVGAVNLFGLMTMLAWPMLGSWIGLSDEAFGVWSGTSIHAVPQVVAAGFAFSPDAGTLATLVKLVRVTFLAPMVFVLALLHAKRTTGSDGDKLTVHYTRLIPWFVWAFLGFATLNTLGLIPTLEFAPTGLFGGSGGPVSLSMSDALRSAGKVMLTLAMAAIGLEVSMRHLIAVGGRVVTAGFVCAVLLGAVSLGLILILM
jgi:uncharacterized integral membrane protein (TIGR00698 family)